MKKRIKSLVFNALCYKIKIIEVINRLLFISTIY